MDDDDDFFDTLSFTSISSRKRSQNKDYLGLSRNTIYHSTYDIIAEDMEMMPRGNGSEGDQQNQRSRSFTNRNLQVDFVLAYESTNNKPSSLKAREVFERNLRKKGLKLEKDENQKVHFVKIHVPDDVLYQYAELLKLRIPIKEMNLDNNDEEPKKNNCFSKMRNRLSKSLELRLYSKRKYQLTAEFDRQKKYLFDLSSPSAFDESVRITIVSYILDVERYGEGDQDKGIKRLIAEKVYLAAYPLHDRDLVSYNSRRRILADQWASIFPFKWVKYQPIDEIKEYFGVKFALYFTWLGFYTNMLIPASIVGILCFFYAIGTYSSNRLVHDVCTMDVIMCPRCDKYCDYWKLNESCTYSKIQHFVDNPATIAFALFMSLWSSVYLELWKRYSAELRHRWGLTGFDLLAEPPRPEYLLKLANSQKERINAVTRTKEPVVAKWKRLPSLILSFSIAILFVMLAVGVVFGVVLYRMSVIASDTLLEDDAVYNAYIMPVTAGLINLVCIMILNYCYNILAKYLTDMEYQRTQTQYDESLSFKIYMFQFVNFYSSIFYIAFLKGKFVGYPYKYNRIFKQRQEECNPGGCLMELTIQLAIIMIGKQFINAVMEYVIPYIMQIYKSVAIKAGYGDSLGVTTNDIINANQWTEDYTLSSFESNSLFEEYLEMVLQYGFVTIFIAAFPLAPLFALINNVFEMRLDAKKFIRYYRRPVPQRVKDIGIWVPILGILGKISVVSNAFIIAFSSNFIPRLVYMAVNPQHTDEGYLNFTLAYFNTSDFPKESAPIASMYSNVTTCRYPEFRNPPSDDPTISYKRPLIYWHILTARLAFVVAYQNAVTMVITAVEWIIPDISRKLSDQIKMEAYTTNESIVQHEAEQRARNRHSQLSQDNTIINGNATPDGLSNRTSVYFDSRDQNETSS